MLNSIKPVCLKYAGLDEMLKKRLIQLPSFSTVNSTYWPASKPCQWRWGLITKVYISSDSMRTCTIALRKRSLRHCGNTAWTKGSRYAVKLVWFVSILASHCWLRVMKSVWPMSGMTIPHNLSEQVYAELVFNYKMLSLYRLYFCHRMPFYGLI